MTTFRTTMRKSALTLSLGAVILMCLAIGLYAFAFQAGVTGAPDFHERFARMPLFAAMHVIGGGTVLLIGSFQFIGRIRTHYPVVHRTIGRIYLIFVMVGGIGGLALAPRSEGGLTAHLGFGMLAILWLFSATRAFTAIRAGRVAEHRAWMLRNFAMTFGAVTLRLYLGLFTALGVPFAQAYPAVAWIAWVPNLILVEWLFILPTLEAHIYKRHKTAYC